MSNFTLRSKCSLGSTVETNNPRISAGLYKHVQASFYTLTREADLTCQSPDCVLVVSSHTLERSVHPN